MCKPSDENTVVSPSFSGPSYDAAMLSKEDKWIETFDHDAFKEDVKQLGKQLAEQQGPEDVAHLRKIVRWQRFCVWSGFLTCWYCVNPFSIYMLSLGIMVRWTIIAHHVCHGGFDKCSDGQYSRFKFGVGSLYRRVVDWLDWMLVEAWNVEHNQLHHYCLGEENDPDLVEFNFQKLREDKSIPMWAKRASMPFVMAAWKWFYYAPNTFKQLKLHEFRRKGQALTPEQEEWKYTPWTVSWSWLSASGPIFFTIGEFVLRVVGPYFVRQFLVLPAIFAVTLGKTAATNALISLVLAEVLTNLHSFLVIVTNHAGDDLYRFERHCTARTSTYYLRQVISSVNFRTSNGVGGAVHGFMADLNDFHHGWLNYQIEHHVWPDLSMLSYQKSAPLMRALCKKHGVPYVQENVFWRLKKTVDIIVGDGSMRRYPSKWEREQDLAPLDRTVDN